MPWILSVFSTTVVTVIFCFRNFLAFSFRVIHSVFFGNFRIAMLPTMSCGILDFFLFRKEKFLASRETFFGEPWELRLEKSEIFFVIVNHVSKCIKRLLIVVFYGHERK